MSTTEDDESVALLERRAGDSATPPLRPADVPTLSTALSDAAAAGSAEGVRLALERGAPVDAKSRYGESALTVATREGYVDVVAELLHHGADAGIRDVFGKTPLSTAASYGHAAVVTELLANGAVVDMADASGNTPLMSAADAGFFQVVVALLEAGAAVNARRGDGETALMRAAESGCADVVAELVEREAVVDATNNIGSRALSFAARANALLVVKELLGRGAEVDAKDLEGRTALAYAAQRSAMDAAAELLRNGANVNSVDKCGRTPLLEAAKAWGSSTVYEQLVESGAEVDAKDIDGRTALSWAAETNDAAMVAFLLQRGASVNVKDSRGRSALSHAAGRGHSKTVAELLKHGAITDEKDGDGKSAIWHATDNGHRLMVIELLRYEQLASPDYSDDVVECFVAAAVGKLDGLKTLIENGIPVDVNTSDGRTLLFYAAECGNSEVVEFLLASGASVRVTASKPGRSGDTPLTLAGSAGHMRIFRDLLRAGAPVNVRGDNGETPLISLARYDYFQGVQQLVALGAAIRVEDASEDEYPLIPGTLETMQEMCGATFEFKTMCARVLRRLDETCSELQERPRSDLVSFAGVIFRFCRLLLDVTKHVRPLARLIANRAIASKVQAFHEELDHFIQMLRGEENHVSTSWSMQLERDRAQVLAQLSEILGCDEAVVVGLPTSNAFKDAALRLQYELMVNSREGHSQARQMLDGVQQRLLHAARIEAPEVPEWFVSPDDVEFYAWNFLRTQHETISWYEGTWRRARAVIETGNYEQIATDASQWFQLRHPNVVKLLGACAIGSPTFFVFEVPSDAKSLVEFLEGVKDDSDRAVATWRCLHAAALGLQYLHNRGVIHGDLRSENIIVGGDSSVKLGGLRTLKYAYANQKRSWAKWVSPETARDKSAASTKSDIFAFGLCIWEAVMQKAPKARDGLVPGRPANMGDAEWDLITKMCAQDPSDRGDIAYVASRLKQLLLVSRRHDRSKGDGDECSELPQPRAEEEVRLLQHVMICCFNTPNASSLQLEDMSLEGHAFVELEGATIPSTLRAIHTRCKLSSNDRWLADKVLPALDFIFHLLKERGKGAADVEVLRFCVTTSRFKRYLRTAVSERSVFELARSRQVAESHHVMYAELDRQLNVLGVSNADPIRAWKCGQAVAREDSDHDELDTTNAYVALDVLSRIPHTMSFLREPNESSSAVSLHHFDSSFVNRTAWTRDGLVAESAHASTMRPPSWHLGLQELIFSEADKIGQGAFGAVYRGSWLDTPVVVKFMGYEEDADTISTDLLLHEVRVWHRLSHPHVLKLYGANHVDKRYFVCEFAGNGDLLDFLKRPGNATQVWQKMYEAALGLEYLHETHNVAHNDLKCDNIMVGLDGKAKLIDFGLSALLNEAEVQIDVKRMGAVHWRSPEYLSGGRPSFASDVYSFAMCLIEAASGDIPWGKSVMPGVVRFKVKRGSRPAMPDTLNDKQRNLIELMTKFDPSERVKMGFVVDKLQEISQDEAANCAP